MSKLSKSFYVWLFTVFIFALPILTSYSFVQQEARAAINVPLVQKMQVVKAEIQAGEKPTAILQGIEVDLSVDQNPFVILYSLDKKIVGSSAHLNGESLSVPVGVLENAQAKGEVRVTWQPTSDLRFASITDYVPTFGYVSVAQSLRETEDRATRSMWLALVALALGSLTSGVGIMWFRRLTDTRSG